MNAAQEQAALLIAQGQLKLTKIAEQTGIALRSLTRLKSESKEFQEAVARFEKVFEAEIRRTGLATVNEQIRHKKMRHGMIRAVFALRSKDKDVREHFGIGAEESRPELGLVCVKWKGKDACTPEYSIDVGSLGELDQLEQDIMILTGDWKQKHEITAPEGIALPPALMVLAPMLTEEQLDALEAALKARAEHPQPEPDPA